MRERKGYALKGRCVCVYAHAHECVHASVQRGACIHMCVKEKHIELHQIVKTAEKCFKKNRRNLEFV